MVNLFRNLFIPQKNLAQFDQAAFRSDMAAIENWANNFSSITFDTQIGSPPPQNVQSTLKMGVVTVTCVAGIGDYTFPTAYKFGYLALVSSGYYAAADSIAVDSSGSTLDFLQIYAVKAGAAVTGTVDVVYLIVGA